MTSVQTGKPDPYAAFADRALFTLLLALVAVRPLLAESFYSIDDSFLGDLASRGFGPSLATTPWLDALTLILVMLIWRRHPPVPARWFTVGFALLAGGVLLSSAFAGDRRAALNAGFDLLTGILAAAALVTACRARWMTHLVIAAAIATSACAAVKCVQQWSWEFADTLDRWERVERPGLESIGVDTDSPYIENFERRLRAALAQGYQNHPNIAAACLHAGWLLAAALAAAALFAGGAWNGTRLAGLLIPLTALGLIGFAIVLTGSNGALGAAALGAMLLIFWRFPSPANLKRLVVGAYLALLFGGAAYGLTRGTLPHTSLAFRWEYWTAAAKAFAERPITGYGRENFLTPYLLYKSAESTEQVRNPHGLWAALPVELGLLGLAGGAVLLLGALWRLLTPPSRAALEVPLTPAATAHSLHAAGAVLVLHAAFSAMPFADPNVTILWLIDLALVYVVAFLLALRAVEIIAGTPHGQRIMILGSAAALLAAMIHNLIDYSFFTPAGLAAVALPLAAGFSLLSPADAASDPIQPRAASPPRWPIWAVLIITLIQVGPVAWMTGESERLLKEMRVLSVRFEQYPETLRLAEAATRADPLNPQMPRQIAQTLMAMATIPGLPLDQTIERIADARRFARLALERNPASPNPWRLLARINSEQATAWELRGESEPASASRIESAQAWEQTLARDPTNERAHLSAAGAWLRIWRLDADPATAERVRRHVESALRIDATRTPDNASKLRPHELERLEAALIEIGDPPAMP